MKMYNIILNNENGSSTKKLKQLKIARKNLH